MQTLCTGLMQQKAREQSLHLLFHKKFYWKQLRRRLSFNTNMSWDVDILHRTHARKQSACLWLLGSWRRTRQSAAHAPCWLHWPCPCASDSTPPVAAFMLWDTRWLKHNKISCMLHAWCTDAVLVFWVPLLLLQHSRREYLIIDTRRYCTCSMLAAQCCPYVLDCTPAVAACMPWREYLTNRPQDIVHALCLLHWRCPCVSDFAPYVLKESYERLPTRWQQKPLLSQYTGVRLMETRSHRDTVHAACAGVVFVLSISLPEEAIRSRV